MEVKLTTYVIVGLVSFFSPSARLITIFIVWSNFEIADLDFWRGEAYSAFFEFLDSKGGFYYEVPFPSLFFLPRSLTSIRTVF
jgi:Glycolipid 2-alpha-mannosyltransferase